MSIQGEESEARGVARYALFLVMLVGVVFISASHLPFDVHHYRQDIREIVKEVGITLLAVGSMSFLYEWLIFEKHSQKFLAYLRREIRKGESNAAACAHLGIEEIYAERWKFMSAYSIDDLLKQANADTTLRIFARSAHNLMSERVHIFTSAIAAGAHVKLCLLNPKCPEADLKLTQDVTRHDLQSAVWNLREQLTPILRAESLKGHLEVRYHSVPMLDSFLDVTTSGRRICAWDLSFGRKVEQKHIFRVDPVKTIGLHLLSRYDLVWNLSDPVYEWNAGKQSVNRL